MMVGFRCYAVFSGIISEHIDEWCKYIVRKVVDEEQEESWPKHRTLGHTCVDSVNVIGLAIYNYLHVPTS